jgi:phosphoglycerol transferase MdoB-like AlkP superfamily enzyme
MEIQTNPVEVLFEKTGEYLETKAELLKLQVVNTTSDVTSSVISRLVIAAVLGLVVLILNAGIAIWIGDVLGKIYYGFFLVSGFYIVVILLLYFFRHQWIKMPLHNMLIKKMLN